MTKPHTPLQFGLGSLFRLMTVLACTAAMFAWTVPYFAVGVDPPLVALPFFGLALGGFAIAITYPRWKARWKVRGHRKQSGDID